MYIIVGKYNTDINVIIGNCSIAISESIYSMETMTLLLVTLIIIPAKSHVFSN